MIELSSVGTHLYTQCLEAAHVVLNKNWFILYHRIISQVILGNFINLGDLGCLLYLCFERSAYRAVSVADISPGFVRKVAVVYLTIKYIKIKPGEYILSYKSLEVKLLRYRTTRGKMVIKLPFQSGKPSKGRFKNSPL